MKGHNYKFEVVFEREDDGRYHAYCPDLKGCHTFGNTLKSAKKNIAEAIVAYCESLSKHGEPIPASSYDRVVVDHVEVALEAA